MELLQLTYFCSAAETENFSKTAKIYSVPASNISQSMHRLEKELGTALFDRTANRVVLNERGRMLYENVKQALSLINDAKTKLSSTDEVSGEIKILTETNRRLVTKAIEIFQENYKEVSFFINHSSDNNPDKYDIIVSDKIFTQKHLKKQLLAVDDLLLAVRKDNPLAEKKEIKASDLENERFITMGSETGLFRQTNEICNSAGFAPNIVIQSDDPYYIRKYIEMGLGISFVPSFSWKGLFSENICFKHVADAKRYTYVYHNTQKYISKATELFLKTLLLCRL